MTKKAISSRAHIMIHDLAPYLDTPALAIRQPWAWLVIYGGKHIENRSRRTRFRGRFLIHASATFTHDEYDKAELIAAGNNVELPPPDALQVGGIIGEAEIVDCIDYSDSRWFFGKYGYVLGNIKPLPFLPCKGKLGFFIPTIEPPATNLEAKS